MNGNNTDAKAKSSEGAAKSESSSSSSDPTVNTHEGISHVSTEESSTERTPMQDSSPSSVHGGAGVPNTSQGQDKIFSQPNVETTCFATAEQALEAADTVKATGNMAFSTGRLENALTLYQVASRHLSDARRLLQNGK
jgi:hypothetical protein